MNCLLYADDVILLSQNEVGLQNCLKKHFCADWCLDVNLDKTKVLVFNKAGKLYNHEFKFNCETVESVREYKYLGVTFNISGSFSVASSEFYEKAIKGIFKLKRIFCSSYPNSSVAFHIFDNTIKPILTYGCDIWASMSKAIRSTTYLIAFTKIFMEKSCILNSANMY